MDDRLDLARAVGVFDAPSHYQHQLALLDMRDEARRARWGQVLHVCAGVILCVVVGIFILLSFSIGEQMSLVEALP